MLRRMTERTAAQYEPNPPMEGNMNKLIAHKRVEELAGKLAGLGIAIYGFLVVAQVVQSYGLV